MKIAAESKFCQKGCVNKFYVQTRGITCRCDHVLISMAWWNHILNYLSHLQRSTWPSCYSALLQFILNTMIPNKCIKVENWDRWELYLNFWSVNFFFFNWLFIVALTARSYRDCIWFSVGNVTLLIFWTSTVTNDIFLIHGRYLSGRVQCSHRTTTDDINQETRQPHLWGTVWVQVTLSSVGELKH